MHEKFNYFVQLVSYCELPDNKCSVLVYEEEENVELLPYIYIGQLETREPFDYHAVNTIKKKAEKEFSMITDSEMKADAFWPGILHAGRYTCWIYFYTSQEEQRKMAEKSKSPKLFVIEVPDLFGFEIRFTELPGCWNIRHSRRCRLAPDSL